LESAPEPEQASATPAEDERDDESHKVVDGGPGEPVARTVPVFAGAVVEPIPGAEAGGAAPGESDQVEPIADTEAGSAEVDESDEGEPAEEGSWRDAWMFVEE
jgi:hypothetical protein